MPRASYPRPLRIIDLRDYSGIDPTGTNDSTSAIQAAIRQQATAGSNYEIQFAGGRFATTGLKLDKISRIAGKGVYITPAGQTAGALMTLPLAPALQAAERAVLSGIRFDGGSFGRAGSDGASGATGAGVGGLIGLDIGNNPAVVLDDVGFKNLGVGSRFRGMQFAHWRNVKAWQCDVGFYSYQLQRDGGNNSNSFHDLQAITCMVGIVVRAHALATIPNDGMNFFNPTLIENRICAVAVIGGNTIRPVVTIRAGNPEDTSKGVGVQSAFSFDGLSIPQCSVYTNFADLRLDQYQFEEAYDPGKQIIARNRSVVTLQSCRGPGAAGQFVDRDATSTVVVNGVWDGAKNGLMGVSRWDALPIGNDSFLITSLAPTFDSVIPNLQADPAHGDTVNVFGGPSIDYSGFNANPPYAQVNYIASASDGDQNTNAVRWNAPQTGALAVIAFDALASVDHDFVGRWVNNVFPQTVQLKAADGWTRIVHVAVNLSADANQYAFFAKAGAAVNVQFRNFQTWSGADTPANRTILAEILRGGFNRKMVLYGTAPPTVRPWYFGQTYIDTSSQRSYLSAGISSSGDWKIFTTPKTVNTQTGTSFTLGVNDNYTTLILTNSSPITLTLPNSLPVGFNVRIIQGGTGQVTLAAGTGASYVNRSGYTKLAGQNAVGYLLVTANSGGSAAAYNFSGDGV